MMKIGRILNWVLILAGMVEALWGLGQVYGYLPVKHAMYPLTGSFYNPGPYGGFLAMTFPVCLWEVLNHYRNRRKGLAYWTSLMGLVLMGVMLPATMSRTAWVAVAISTVYVCGCVYPTGMKTLGKRLSLKCKYWKVIALLLVLAVGTAGYQMKKDSANGRLLMWKVASQAVLEHPWTGVGWEQVPGAYGDAQEKYFASGNYTETEARVAGSPEYVFNEYLQVAMAWGVPALCGILMVVIVLFCLGHGDGQYGVCGGLFSLGVFAFSSYPFQFMEFIVAFIGLLVACLMAVRRTWVQVGTLVLGLGISLYISENRPERNARQMFDRAHALHRAGEWQASTDLLKETMKVSSDAMILNIIGKNFQKLGKYKEAEVWLIRSTHRLPNRIYPYYLLVKLYAEHPNVFSKEKLEQAARMVMEKEPKVESTAIREMREEVKRIIKAGNHE